MKTLCWRSDAYRDYMRSILAVADQINRAIALTAYYLDDENVAPAA